MIQVNFQVLGYENSIFEIFEDFKIEDFKSVDLLMENDLSVVYLNISEIMNDLILEFYLNVFEYQSFELIESFQSEV